MELEYGPKELIIILYCVTTAALSCSVRLLRLRNFIKKKKTYIEHRTGSVLYSGQLLQVLVEQLKKWQIEQTDPCLLVLKQLHATEKERNLMSTNACWFLLSSAIR